MTTMERHAIISDCEQYRYYLSRRWAKGGRTMVFIMLNPSTADADIDDATIRKCVGFAQRNGCNAIEVINVYAFRATKPKDMFAADDPVGRDNYHHIQSTVRNPDAVIVCAWGVNATEHWDTNLVHDILRKAKVKPMCLSLTKDKYPGHPLMLPYSSTLRPF